MTTILAIDPGPERSAWVQFGDGGICDKYMQDNIALLSNIRQRKYLWDIVVIEKVESFGMAVGVEVFETVRWAGRFEEAAQPLPVHRIGRKAVKLHLCGTTQAKDSNIRQALIDRYGGSSAIGRKASPGPLYGVSGDVWAALAVAITFHDMQGDALMEPVDWPVVSEGKQMNDDPALALLAEALTPLSEYIATISSQRFGFDPERVANDLAATEPGTRLLAALRDGLAVAALTEAIPEKHRASVLIARDGRSIVTLWADNPSKRGSTQRGAADTFHAAVAAALAPETSDV